MTDKNMTDKYRAMQADHRRLVAIAKRLDKLDEEIATLVAERVEIERRWADVNAKPERERSASELLDPIKGGE